MVSKMEGSINILILEDVPLDGELMEKELERDGINFIARRVETEDDYTQALNEFQPHVILADHSLPQFDGISAMRIAQKISPQIPFIFVSGQMGEEFAVEMLKEGATDYVLKHNLSKLPHAVRRALKESDEYFEKKKAEEKLAKSEKKYKTLFNLSPDFVVVLDQKGFVVDINQCLEEVSGLSREDFLDKDINLLAKHFMSDYGADKDLISDLMSSDVPKPLEIKIDYQGKISYIEVHYAPMVVDGEIYAAQIIGRNITKRKNTETALIESRERLHNLNTYLQTIINASPFAIIDLYPDGRVKSLWNASAQNIFGWAKEEVVGQQLPFINKENEEKCQKIISGALSGELKTDIELECLTRNNRLIHTMMATAPISDLDGKIHGVMATFADISDLIDAENQIKASLEEKEVLLREIHHRVKNNLQIISSLISLQSDYTDDPETIKMFQESKNRIRSMALIHEKLYQSKDLAHIDFGEYLKSLMDMLLKFYTEKSRLVDVNLNTVDVNLEIDTAISLGLIVNELVSNSFKHAFPGDMNGEIRIDLLNEDGNYLVKVVDNGVGIPKDIDLKNTESLGLQIVQTLTIQLNGTLKHENKDGTTFTLAFPYKSNHKNQI